MATVNTINDLPALGRTPTSGDKLALQPQGDNTKSIDYDALATAIINKLGGDPVTIAHGGTGGATAAAARTNLSVYSKAETNSAISQSTAYTVNTTENFDGVAIGASGFVTSGATLITFFIDLPKSLDLITSVSCSRFNGVIRGAKGYVNNVSSGINWASTSGITIAAVKVSGNKLRINLTSTNVYTNVDNNTPLNFIGTVVLVLT